MEPQERARSRETCYRAELLSLQVLRSARDFKTCNRQLLGSCKCKSSWSACSALKKAWKHNIAPTSLIPGARTPNRKSKGSKGSTGICNVIKRIMHLKSLLFSHVHYKKVTLYAFFLLLPISRTNTAILLSHNCFLAPSAHSSRAVSHTDFRKDLTRSADLVHCQTSITPYCMRTNSSGEEGCNIHPKDRLCPSGYRN